MARKPRDYKAEERRRNELARQRSGGRFATRAAQRGAIERGEIPALAPERIRSPKTRAAQAKFLSGSAVPKGPTLTYDQYAARYSRRELCEEWASVNARTTAVQFDWSGNSLESAMDRRDPKHRRTRGAEWRSKSSRTNRQKQKWIDAHGIEAYIDAYYRAFVDGPERYALCRHTGSDALHLWFIEITGYMSVSEYETRYVVEF